MLQVTAAVITRKEHFLICQRSSGKWEFPGGKIHEGETPEDCLKRELREELGIETETGALIKTVDHDYPDKSISLHFFESRIVSGHITLHEHQAYEWVSLEELSGYDLSEADRKFVDSSRGTS